MLEERIANAFGQSTTSAALSQLIAEVEAAAIAAGEAAERAREVALDPAISTAEVAAARSARADAMFNSARMKAALEKLRERKLQALAAEEEEHRRAAYEAAKAERDELAHELKTFYPRAAARMAKLAERISGNNKAIKKANNNLPKDAEWLACAEAQARGIPNFAALGAPPQIVSELNLPVFHYEHSQPRIWPPRG